MKTAAIILSALCAGPASALTGNALLQIAEGDNSMFISYVRGVGDASYLTIGAFKIRDGKAERIQPFCIPQGATYEQATDIVRTYLASNAPIRHYPAVILVHNALGAAWPCPAN